MNVSIVIPVFNRVRFLPQAIESALAQTRGPVEVIVVDDGSPTDPQPVLQQFGNSVRLIRKPNGGQASARNAGIAAAQGKYLLFLDEDDYLEPTAIDDLLRALSDHPGSVWVAGKFTYVDEQRNPIAKEHRCRYTSGDVHRALIHDNLIGVPSSALVAADAVRQVGGFDEDPRYLFADDYDLWLSISRLFPLAATSRKVSNYRIHTSQTSQQQPSRLNHAVLAVLNKQWSLSSAAYDADFRTAIAREHLSVGDECFVRGQMLEARRHWKESTKSSPLLAARLWTRFAKSYLPPDLLRSCRHIANSYRLKRVTRP
jgi:glycosyltransferase involved in cell wall biosynthesis